MPTFLNVFFNSYLVPSISEGNEICIGNDVFQKMCNFIFLRDILFWYSNLIR